MQTIQPVKCGQCSTQTRPVYHSNVAAVRACNRTHYLAVAAARKATSPVIYSPPVNQRFNPPAPRPTDWKINTPRVMVEAVRSGRYAVEQLVNGHMDWDFIRVSRPTKGKRKGCLIIQTQHSEIYKPFITVYPTGSVMFHKSTEQLDLALMMVCADPYTSAMNYGRELGCCSRCGRELTDERSRYYSIGPECEKHWPEIINYINETKGAFVE